MTTQTFRLHRVLVQEVGWEDKTAETFLFALDDAFSHLATKDDLRILKADLTAILTGEMWKIVAIGVGIALAALTLASGILIAVLG